MNDIPSLTQHFDPNNGGLVQFGSDDKLFVVFSGKSVLNELKSSQEGRPIYEYVDFVKIQQRGERDYYEQPATLMDKRRFPRQWQAYQEGREASAEGTPLTVLFPKNPELADNLRHFKITTVEQLAILNDTQMQNIGMGGRTFVEQAKKYLSASEKGKGFHELEAKLNKALGKLEELQTKNAALENALAVKSGETVATSVVQLDQIKAVTTSPSVIKRGRPKGSRNKLKGN